VVPSGPTMRLPPDEWARRVIERYAAHTEGYRDCWAPAIHGPGRRLAEGLPMADTDRVLDLGAGTGALLPVLRRLASSAVVVATDLTEAMLRMADPDVPRVTADAQALPFRDNAFDVVVMAFMLFHVPDPVAGLREARRVLVPGGWVGVGTWAGGPHTVSPALAAWEEELEAHGASLPQELSAHDRTDTPEKVAALLEAAGFEVEGAERAPIEHRLTRDEFWERRLKLGSSREPLDSLPEEARAACLRRARERIDAMPDEDLLDRDVAILTTAVAP
jgi:SAM-dependent methyltransferase